jgi:hypothetical protein
MPETAMNEYGLFPAAKDKVGFTWQCTVMQSVSVSQAMDQPPNCHLWSRVFTGDKRHSFTSLFPAEGIRHIL